MHRFGKLKFKWPELKYDLKRDLEAAIVSENGHLNYQNMYTLVRGLRLMGVTVTELTGKTQSSLSACFERTIGSMDGKSFGKTIQRYALLRSILDFD